jgi:hypothetical protein
VKAFSSTFGVAPSCFFYKTRSVIRAVRIVPGVIAAELDTWVKKSASIDWTLRESARARIKVMALPLTKCDPLPLIFPDPP